jgi:16S rRNA (cytidine1402-2'-O)-methyltransferase
VPSSGRSAPAGVLYVVATPLGNLEDITLRALRVLREADLIAAEDTRRSRKLLQHYGIEARLTSYHDFSERRKAPRLLADLQRGKNVALISDAGTPCIADPGYRLVRAAIDAGVRVEPVPGPSAVAAALSVAGLPTDRFVFEGFVPARATARRKLFAVLTSETRTVVVYEAARRLVASLEDLLAVAGERPVAVVRELTKAFEEVVRGSVTEVLAALRQRPPAQLRGEVTLLIGGATAAAPPPAADVTAAIERLRRQGLGLGDIARTLADELGVPRRQVYRLGLEVLQREEDED